MYAPADMRLCSYQYVDIDCAPVTSPREEQVASLQDMMHKIEPQRAEVVEARDVYARQCMMRNLHGQRGTKRCCGQLEPLMDALTEGVQTLHMSACERYRTSFDRRAELALMMVAMHVLAAAGCLSRSQKFVSQYPGLSSSFRPSGVCRFLPLNRMLHNMCTSS